MNKNIDSNTIPETLREWRKALGLTQAQAAPMVFMTTATLMKYETGKRSLSVEEFIRIARIYGHEVTLTAVKL